MSPLLALAFLGFFVLFCLPGLPLGLWLAGTDVRRYPEAAGYGFLLGHLLSSGLVVGLVALFGFSMLTLVLFVVVTGGWLLLAFWRRRPASSRRLQLRPWDRRDWVLFLVLLLVAAALIAEPLARVGEQIPEGYAYRKYFVGDFLKEVAVTAELAKGEIPPQNPWFAGETLHYYWWHFVAPASFYHLTGGAALLKTILLLDTALTDILFLFMLFSTLRVFSATPVGPFLAALIGIAAYSYEGSWLWWKLGEPFHSFVEHARGFNVDGLTRWFWGEPQMDGFFRSLLYTPQHLQALSLLLAVVSVGTLADVLGDLPLAAVTGLVVGASLGYSAFVGGIVALWHALHLGIRCLTRRQRTRSLRGLLLGGSVAAVPLVVFYSLGMFVHGPDTGLMVYTGRALREYGPLVFVMNYGPPVAFAALGLLLAWDQGRRAKRAGRGTSGGTAGSAGAPGGSPQSAAVLPLLLLLGLAIALIGSVAVSGFLNDVGLKLGLVVLTMLLVFTAVGLDILHRRLPAVVFYLLIVLVSGPALVTVFVDRMNSADIHNSVFTLYVSKEDMQAARWIARHVPSRAIVQSSSPDLGVDYFTLIPIFAERRTAVGDSMYARIFEISPAAVDRRQRDVVRLFDTTDPAEAVEILKRYRISYVYVGERERESHPLGTQKFSSAPDVFEKVYANTQVDVFRARSFPAS